MFKPTVITMVMIVTPIFTSAVFVTIVTIPTIIPTILPSVITSIRSGFAGML